MSRKGCSHKGEGRYVYCTRAWPYVSSEDKLCGLSLSE